MSLDCEFWISGSGWKVTILPDIHPANWIVIISERAWLKAEAITEPECRSRLRQEFAIFSGAGAGVKNLGVGRSKSRSKTLRSRSYDFRLSHKSSNVTSMVKRLLLWLTKSDLWTSQSSSSCVNAFMLFALINAHLASVALWCVVLGNLHVNTNWLTSIWDGSAVLNLKSLGIEFER